MPETGTIILTVNRTGQIFISSESGLDIQELAPDNVLDAIVNWRGRNPGAVVVVKGDRDASFGAMADLMDALAEAKTLRFNLMTDLKRKPRAAQRARGADRWPKPPLPTAARPANPARAPWGGPRSSAQVCAST